MFKSVEYAGFEGRPELRAAAQQVVAALAGVVRDWDQQVAVELEAYPDRPAGVEVALTLDLPAARGRGARFLGLEEVQNSEALEARCRSVWARAMDAYLERRRPAWDALLNQPAEV